MKIWIKKVFSKKKIKGVSIIKVYKKGEWIVKENNWRM